MADQAFAWAAGAPLVEGNKVRLLRDAEENYPAWLEAIGAAERWIHFGADVRAFNQPRLDSPLGWMTRDHRKMLGVDGRVGFVTGLCVGDVWCGGDRCDGADPWRDTGVAVWGPAVADIEGAFADVWAATGTPLPADEIVAPGSVAPAGTPRFV